MQTIDPITSPWSGTWLEKHSHLPCVSTTNTLAVTIVLTIFNHSVARQLNNTERLHPTVGLQTLSGSPSEQSAVTGSRYTKEDNLRGLSSTSWSTKTKAFYKYSAHTSTTSGRSKTADNSRSGTLMPWSTNANTERERKISEGSYPNLSQNISECLKTHARLTIHVEHVQLLYNVPQNTSLPTNIPLSCNLSIITATNKTLFLEIWRSNVFSGLCSEQNYIEQSSNLRNSVKRTDCVRREHDAFITLTNTIDFVLVMGQPQVSMIKKILVTAMSAVLETGNLTATMGNQFMDHDSVELYAGGKSPENIVWQYCYGPVPSPETHSSSVVYVRFTSSGILPGTKSHHPTRLPGGLWNCSVPEWPDFRPHFRCNLYKDCQERQDETGCFYNGNCGQGHLTLGNRCYVYIRKDYNMYNEYVSWMDSNQECSLRGGYLASLNTPEELKLVRQVLAVSVHPRSLYIGLRTTPATMPFMYADTHIWADQTMAYFAKTWTATGENCGSTDMVTKLIQVIDSCRDRNRYDLLCELDKTSVDGKENHVGSPNNLPPRPQNASFTILVAACPAGHVTHAFLACDELSACWLSRRGYRESEAWGIPSRASCPANMTSLPAMFVCSSGWQRVPYSLVCDRRQHCTDDSDESFCMFPSCSEDTVLCSASEQCVPVSAICNGQMDCTDETDEARCSSPTNVIYPAIPPPAVVNFRHVSSSNKRQAFTIKPIPQSDQMVGSYMCPETHFQCADNGYCLPVYLRCNSVNDCPGREDEVGCDDSSTSCPGFYRCRSYSICLHPSHVCDDMYQCPQHDDELFCRLVCPAGCTCHGLAFTCRHAFRAELYPKLKFLDASGSGLTQASLGANTLLIHLSLSACGLVNLHNMTFPNLGSLDLSHNNIESINLNRLRGMPNLQYLRLSRNPLKSLFSSTKDQISFPAMRKLDVSGVKLQLLHTSDFSSFPGLHSLNLSHCGIEEVAGQSLVTTNSLLRVLDAVGCPMTRFPHDLLSGMDQLQEIRADNFKLCCPDTLPSGFKRDNCRAPFDEVSSCQSLLRSDLYRVCLYIFCGLALVGNLACFLWRCFPFKSSTSGFGVFVTHLNVSDFLMGVYLAVIGVADRMYRGSYLWKDIQWRHSAACSMAGYLSLLSSEVSAFIICLITLDRFLVLRFPFSSLHFKARSAHTTCVIVWIIGALMALVPLTPLASHWSFYSLTGICIPLPVTRKFFAGHLYAFGIIIVFNFFLFFFIAVGQAAIYVSIRANRLSEADSTKKSNDLRIARRLITVAVSDFLCWFPIGLVGLLASRGVPISSEVNVGMAILVLPLNSSLNPFLYTINIILERQRRSRDDQILKQLMARMSEDDKS